MEYELDDIRPRYRLCRAGFGLLALALGLLCGAKVAFLAMLFGAHREMEALMGHPAWLWLVDAPITWGSLLGSYLLLGRWPTASWRRRAGLLVLMNTVDAGMWTVDRAEQLGLNVSTLDLSWTFTLTAFGLGWFELMLAASLAADVCTHLGREEARESRDGARSLAIIGLALWTILALTQTDWWSWPLRPRMTAEIQVLLLLSTVLMLVLSFMVTVLSLTAARLCARHVRELDRLDSADDLLRSRSETEEDDLFRGR